jgi:cell division protein FtsW
MADRTVVRRRPKSAVAGGSHLRLVRTEDLMRAAPTPVAVTRRNLSLLLVPTALLTVIGLVMILSAGSISAVEGYGTSFWYFNRQTLYAAAGVIGLVVTARVPYAFWRRAAIPMLLAVLPVMMLTLHPAFGSSLYGASRWIDLGPITLQPAEFAKFLTVCAAAAILSRPWKHLDRPRDAFLPLGPLVAVVAGVVMLQKDLGTTVVICGSVFLLLFAAGLRLRHLAWTGLAGAAVMAFFIFGTAYRRTRFLEAWLNWELDPSGAGWQLRQGLIALGSGGWLGIGLGNSRQKWDYLPNAHSDFVFAVLGEELGLVGALAVLSLFGMLLFAGIRIAVNAPNTFGRLLAAGITGWIGLQTLVNLGAVTGLLPITGVPLPFLSFGGTALVVTLAGVGVMASVALDGVRSAERRHIRDRRRHGSGGSRR